MEERGFYSDLPNLRVRSLFTKQECQALIDKIGVSSSHQVLGDPAQPYRKADILFMDIDQLGALSPRLPDKILSALEFGAKLFGHELLFFPSNSIQLSSYPVGGVYGWHVDSTKQDNYLRLMTLLVELSDPGNYSGGGLESRLYEDSTETQTDFLQQGEAIMFPSNRPHRALRIHSGTRQSLACWGAGEINPSSPFVSS